MKLKPYFHFLSLTIPLFPSEFYFFKNVSKISAHLLIWHIHRSDEQKESSCCNDSLGIFFIQHTSLATHVIYFPIFVQTKFYNFPLQFFFLILMEHNVLRKRIHQNIFNIRFISSKSNLWDEISITYFTLLQTCDYMRYTSADSRTGHPFCG